MGGISDVNTRAYRRLITCWPQPLVLCGKATKLAEATAQSQERNSSQRLFLSFSLLSGPSAPTSSESALQCPPSLSLLIKSHSPSIALEKMPSKHITFHTQVGSSSPPISPCILSRPEHPPPQATHVLRTEVRNNNNLVVNLFIYSIPLSSPLDLEMFSNPK